MRTGRRAYAGKPHLGIVLFPPHQSFHEPRVDGLSRTKCWEHSEYRPGQLGLSRFGARSRPRPSRGHQSRPHSGGSRAMVSNGGALSLVIVYVLAEISSLCRLASSYARAEATKVDQEAGRSNSRNGNYDNAEESDDNPRGPEGCIVGRSGRWRSRRHF